MKQVSIPVLLVALLASCGNASKSGNNDAGAIPLFEIVSNPDHPTHIALRLVSRTDGDTSVTYVAEGLYQGDTVGFHIELDKRIVAGISADGLVDEENGFTTGSITFLRSGPE